MKYTWPREPEIVDNPDGTTTTFHANGNPLGITYWSYEIYSGEWFIASGVGGRWSVRLASRMDRRRYRRNGRAS